MKPVESVPLRLTTSLTRLHFFDDLGYKFSHKFSPHIYELFWTVVKNVTFEEKQASVATFWATFG